MYDVLVPVDDSTDRALTQARCVTDLPLVEPVHAIVFHVFTGDNPQGATVSQVGAARRARDHLTEHGVEVTLDESSGDPAQGILDGAEKHGVDLIAVAGRQRSPAGKALLGSVSQDVLLSADRPVLFCSDEPEEAE